MDGDKRGNRGGYNLRTQIQSHGAPRPTTGNQIRVPGGIDKVKVYQKLKRTLKFKDDQVAFVGDDILDIPLLKLVGFPICVKNADARAKKHAKLVTKTRGGEGAIREVVEFILKAKRKNPLEWVP